MATRRAKRAAAARQGQERVFGLVRISKARDGETSTTTQPAAIESWCVTNDAELVEISIEARSSYKDSQRHLLEGRKRALQLLRAGAITTVAVWKVSRAARNLGELLEFVREIESLGGRFVSVTEGDNFDTSTTSGKLMLVLLGVLAEIESDAKSDNIEEWQEHRLALKMTPTGPRPFGYRRAPNELHIIEDEAAIIREAADEVLDGKSLIKVAARLVAAGVQGEQKGTLTARSLKRILLSPTTAALREIDGVLIDCSSTWEPILDRQTYDRLRTMLLDPQRTSNPVRGGGRKHLLGGMLICGKDDCGGRFRIKITSVRANRYECAKCKQSVPQAEVDELIERGVTDALDRETWARLRRRGARQFDTHELETRLAELAERAAAPRNDPMHITSAEWEIMRAGIVRDLNEAADEPLELPDVSDPRREWVRLDIEAKRLLIAAAMPRIVVNAAVPGRQWFDEERIVPEMA
jgi:site-specific DNA recombinase